MTYTPNEYGLLDAIACNPNKGTLKPFFSSKIGKSLIITPESHLMNYNSNSNSASVSKTSSIFLNRVYISN